MARLVPHATVARATDAGFIRDQFTCQRLGCGRVEGNTSLLAADHDKPYEGDPLIFWDEDGVKTRCKSCHGGPKQRAELAVRL